MKICYRYDNVLNTYFAQAREYVAGVVQICRRGLNKGKYRATIQSDSGAFGNGHAAPMLLRSDDTGDLYEFNVNTRGRKVKYVNARYGNLYDIWNGLHPQLYFAPGNKRCITSDQEKML